jgi:hypothetical protein
MANILNNSDAGYHIGTMCLIYRVLRRASKPLTTEGLTELCAPSTLSRRSDHPKKFPQTLTFWQHEAHCLWQKHSDSTLTLLDRSTSPEPGPREIADIVRRALFAKEIPDITVKIRSKGTRDQSPPNHIEPLLLQSAALLASGLYLPFKGDPFRQANISSFTVKHLEDRHTLNDSELAPLISWLLFLGFMEIQSGEYWLDPTRAVGHAITEILKPKQPMDIRKFMEKLGKQLPVIDGGIYQLQAASVMASKGWSYDYHTAVSPALSHAFNRLQVANIVKFTAKSDDPDAIQLIQPQTNKKSLISQITLLRSNVNA